MVALYPLAESGQRDSGLGTRDSGLGIRDSGLGIRDSGFGTRALPPGVEGVESVDPI